MPRRHEVTPGLAYGEPGGLYTRTADTVAEAVAIITDNRGRAIVPDKETALAVLDHFGVDPERADWLCTPFTGADLLEGIEG